jgi:hypothetical protein
VCLQALRGVLVEARGHTVEPRVRCVLPTVEPATNSCHMSSLSAWFCAEDGTLNPQKVDEGKA